jgi:RNA polymerase-binding transcription factor DksA
MSHLDLDDIEERLLEARDQTLEDIRQAEAEEAEGQRESSGALSRMPSHMADAASDTQEAEKDLANVNRESQQLTRIDEALQRLRDDPETFGICAECGRPIEAERMELIPWTRLCAACATGEEEATAGR